MENINQVLVKVDIKKNLTEIEGTPNGSWTDLAVLLEGIGLLIGIEDKKIGTPEENPKHIKTKKELVEYIKSYLDNVAAYDSYKTPNI